MLLDIDGKKIHYEKTGSSRTVMLFVHGWAGNILSLADLANYFIDNYTTITLDLPGFGQSSNPDPEWGIPEYSDLLIKFLDKLEVERVIYFGHSFGGALGVYLASTYPDRIEKLILAAPSYRRPQIQSQQKTITTKLWGNFVPNTAKRLYFRIFYPYSDSYKVPHMEANFRKIITQDLTALTSTIKQPTLILWGDHDDYVQLEDAHLLNKNIAGSTLKVYSGFTHSLPKTNPEVIVGDIKNFLKQ